MLYMRYCTVYIWFFVCVVVCLDYCGIRFSSVPSFVTPSLAFMHCIWPTLCNCENIYQCERLKVVKLPTISRLNVKNLDHYFSLLHRGWFLHRDTHKFRFESMKHSHCPIGIPKKIDNYMYHILKRIKIY